MTPWRQLLMRDVMLEFHDGPHATPPPVDGGPVYLGIKNISDAGFLDFNEVRHIAERDFRKWTRRVRPQPGDVVFTYEATLHRYALIPEEFRGCLGRRLALIRPNREVVLPRFLHFLMLGPEWRATVTERVISGATVDRVPIMDFPNFPIRLPDLATQHAVVDVLGAIDDLIESNRRRIELLEQIAQAIYREWFVHFRYPRHEEATFVDSPLGPIPDGWEVTALHEVAEVVRGRSYRKHELVNVGGAPFINLKCMRRGGGFRRDGLKRYQGMSNADQRVRPGDIVLAVTDLTQQREILARATLVPRLGEDFGVISLDVVRVVPNERDDRLALLFALQCSNFADRVREFANGSTVLHLSPTHVAQGVVPWPAEPLRRQFVRVIEPIISLVEVLEEAAECLSAARDLMLPKLVSGQIDVSELDLVEGDSEPES